MNANKNTCCATWFKDNVRAYTACAPVQLHGANATMANGVRFSWMCPFPQNIVNAQVGLGCLNNTYCGT